ncbi:MAG: N utilization substance protein B [Gammaproteobacteria bacterium GWE2_42_36]|nr:MAG: N utilization substance protein B [Gammaproteobacteria bacterium GWE2_42_36]HCU05141.1 transcription antitermination factor NusB [Coxiellaceae bacterium]
MKPAARRKARKLAVQALYQWLIAQSPMNEIETQFLSNENLQETDVEYFSDLIRGVETHVDQLDQHFTPFLDRAIKTLDPVELCILRLSTYEFAYRPEIPFRIILNEALELAKIFGSTDGFKFVNGVLNKVARQLRPHELI